MADRAKPAPVAMADEPSPSVERLLLRLDEVARSLGFTERTLNRLRSAGKFPKPDVQVGRMPLWKPATVRAWIEQGGVR